MLIVSLTRTESSILDYVTPSIAFEAVSSWGNVSAGAPIRRQLIGRFGLNAEVIHPGSLPLHPFHVLTWSEASNHPYGGIGVADTYDTVSFMRASTKRKLGQLWGYLLLGVVAIGWLGSAMGPGIIAIISSMVVIYALFQAPMWCCAETRGNELCRNNAYGILLGCHLKQHKWQKFRMVVSFGSWGRLAKRVLSSIGGIAASLSALAATVSAVTALLTLLLK